MGSLKSTDYAELIHVVIKLLLKIPEVRKPLEENKDLLEKIDKNVNDWEKDIKSYYENTEKKDSRR